MTKLETQFEPNWTIHPGEILEEALEERNLTQAEFAERTEYSKKHINRIIKGKTEITPEASRRFEHVLGIKAYIWLNLELNHKLRLAKIKNLQLKEDFLAWAKKFPYKEMISRGWIEGTRDLVDELLDFFRVSSPKAWEALNYNGNLRQSEKLLSNYYSLSAWITRAEQMAGEFDAVPYDRKTFKESLCKIRALTDRKLPYVIPELVETCAKSGVIFIYLPLLSKASVFGFAKWLNYQTPMIVVSDYYKTNDIFWFTFFHEATHILKAHDKKTLILDYKEKTIDDIEAEANNFAANILIDDCYWEIFVERNRFSENAIVSFANEIGISPAIVLGRLQKEGHISYQNFLNSSLKIRYNKISDDDLESIYSRYTTEG